MIDFYSSGKDDAPLDECGACADQAAPDFYASGKDWAPRDECGVFGIYAPHLDVARLAYFGLFALQHRGQESAGISVADVDSIATYKEMGLVNQVFHEEVLSGMRGHAAIM